MGIDKLLAHRAVWNRKPGLREVYTHDFFERIKGNMAPGKASLEVGGGPGFFKQHAPEVISSDLILCPWHDLSCDAQQLPFPDGMSDNVVGLDVLHHIPDPMHFLSETTRVLRPGGRLVLIEPWISPLGYLVNRFFMSEDLNFQWHPGEPIDLGNKKKKPFDGNPAIPFLLFGRDAKHLPELLPTLKLLQVERFGFLAYLLSLGFRNASLLPGWAYGFVHSLETATRATWVRCCALKALIVMERI
jgi:SAM-dependent methyltransferase